MIGFIVLLISIIGSIIWLWVGGIDYMAKNHPDYKGGDFFSEDDKDNIF
jgi:hypothetical protein